MTEAIVIGFFLSILLLLHYREQKEIQIAICNNYVRKIGALCLAITLLVVFWPDTQANQLKLVIVCLMIASFSFLKEGLGESRLIKVGFLDAPYETFKSFQVEEVRNKRSYVTLYKGDKNNSFSFFSTSDLDTITRFLESKRIKNK